MKYIEIEAKRLKPNEHNPNAMTDERYSVLKKNIAENGIIHPLLVRKLKEDEYQIIDGEHRYRVGLSFKFKKFPCVVVDLDDVDTKLQTINMNGLRGKFDSGKLEALIIELSEKLNYEKILYLTGIKRDIHIPLDEEIPILIDEEIKIPEEENVLKNTKETLTVCFSKAQHDIFLNAITKTNKNTIPEALMFMVDSLS